MVGGDYIKRNYEAAAVQLIEFPVFSDAPAV
jgi:hypothetical protein